MLTLGPKSKRKRSKTTAIDKAVETFMAFQSESEEKFMRLEEQRWKRELEYEEKRRREDREHEMRMMQMLMHYAGPPINPYEDYHEY